MSDVAFRPFRRWHEPEKPGLLPIPPLVLRALGARVHPSDPRIALLREALVEGDPLADAVVGWMQESPSTKEARALFEIAVERGIDALERAPAALVAFFAEVDRRPAWIDDRKLKLGTDTMLRVGRHGTYALGASSLMSGYLSRGAVKPLAATGALKRMARRRLAETGKFTCDVAMSGTLDRFSPGIKTTLRVRVMHALVRRQLLVSPTFVGGGWGVPINQSDMLGTTLQFSIAYVLGLAAMGHLLSPREREAVMHVWRWVGLTIGVRDDLLPTTFAQGLELAALLNSTEEGPDDDSRQLAAALVDVWAEGAPSSQGIVDRGIAVVRGKFLTGLSRRILGTSASDALAIPDDVWKLAPFVVAPVNLAMDLLEHTSARLRRRAIRRGKEQLDADLRLGLEGTPPDYWVEARAREATAAAL